MGEQETPDAAHERGYAEGRRAAALSRLREVLAEFWDASSGTPPEVHLARLADERACTQGAMRSLAREHGIAADWPEDLYLPDVVEKRIGRGLAERKVNEGEFDGNGG